MEEIIKSLSDFQVVCTRQNYICKNFASEVLQISEKFTRTHDISEQVAAIDPPTQLYVNESKIVCFRASSGNARVVGLPWTFTVNGTPSTDTLTRNCTSVSLAQPGTATVVANAAGVSTTIAIPVVINPSRRHSLLAVEPNVADDGFATAGERAQASLLMQ